MDIGTLDIDIPDIDLSENHAGGGRGTDAPWPAHPPVRHRPFLQALVDFFVSEALAWLAALVK
jgi:hypothetical protein